MKFQIENIIIWPKKTYFKPRVLNFELGKVNIITGASRTGKTAIIPIVDYCLASDKCLIPIEIIRDNASWYGIVAVLEDDKVLIARKAPDGNISSDEFYFLREKDIVIPDIISAGNETKNGIKIQLNNIAQLPYINRDNDESGYDNRLSFRDLSHLVFQSQDIVANQAILFYKTHLTENREKLIRWFPFILGAEDITIMDARRKLKDVLTLIKQKEREFNSAKNVSKTWLNTLLAELQRSSSFGLHNELIDFDYTQDQLLSVAKGILNDNPNNLNMSRKTITVIETEIDNIELEEEKNSGEIAEVEKRLKNITDVEKTLKTFNDGTKRKINRLGISEWFMMNKRSANQCPFCGSTEHPNANKEIEKICKVLKSYENTLDSSIELPASLSREKQELEKRLESLLEEKKLLRDRYDQLNAKNEETKLYSQQRKDMFKFLGQLEYTVKMIDNLSDTGSLSKELDLLYADKVKYESIVNDTKIISATEVKLKEISQLMLSRLKTLDVDPKYQRIPPRFSIKELSIEVDDDQGYCHLLSEIGSASNWVAFHLALTCALQEFFINQRQQISYVPSFIIYDQPSQVYFPRIIKDKNEEPRFDSEDVGAVRKIFNTLATSIITTKGKWQAIVLDHADLSIYHDIEGIYEVDEWRNGKKLIPEEWYL